MSDHIDNLLPFYLNHTLSETDASRVHAHLAACAACRQTLASWQAIAAAPALSPALPPAHATLPALSPLVTTAPSRRPSLPQAAAAARHLIWSQRHFINHTWFLPSLGILALSGALAAFLSTSQAGSWTNMPLFAIVPMAAALITAFLSTLEDDPASELITAAPISLAALLFARLTLALSATSLLGFLGSLLASLVGSPPTSLFGSIALWLGPMLLLSALTTVFSLTLHPRFAAVAALGLWGALLILLFSERIGTPLLKISLLWLLQPGWELFASQTFLAGLLWFGAWLLLRAGPPTLLNPEGRL